MLKTPQRLLAAVLIAVCAGRATAQPVAPSPYPAALTCADLSVQYTGSVDADLPCAACAPDWFATDRFSYEVLVGDYASTSVLGPGAAFDPANPTTKKRSVDVDYIPIDLRLGYRPFLPARRGGPRWCEQLTLLFDARCLAGLNSPERSKVRQLLAQILMQAAGLSVEGLDDDER